MLYERNCAPYTKDTLNECVVSFLSQFYLCFTRKFTSVISRRFTAVFGVYVIRYI